MTDSWLLEGTQAACACGALVGVLDLELPSRGLRRLALAVEPIEGHLMAVDLPGQAASGDERWRLADAYARGADLTATYEQPRGEPFILQVSWRVVPTKNRETATLETMLSINTRQWEAYPAVRLQSALPSSTARRHEGGVLFNSLHGWAYVETALPTDFTLASNPQLNGGSQWQFGGHFMERGVIRRLRLRGAIVPIGEAEHAVSRLLSDLSAEPPPLTT